MFFATARSAPPGPAAHRAGSERNRPPFAVCSRPSICPPLADAAMCGTPTIDHRPSPRTTARRRGADAWPASRPQAAMSEPAACSLEDRLLLRDRRPVCIPLCGHGNVRRIPSLSPTVGPAAMLSLNDAVMVGPVSQEGERSARWYAGSPLEKIRMQIDARLACLSLRCGTTVPTLGAASQR